MIKLLYVNHKKQQCGVYEFGKEISNLLASSNKYIFHYSECDSLDEFKEVYKSFHPDIIIYNYYPNTMKWVNPVGIFAVPIKFQFKAAVHVGIFHEVYQQAADEANFNIFDFHIAPDPTLLLKNPIVYKTGRLLPQKAEYTENNEKIPVIGSFGFATSGKGFEKIVTLVQNEFNEAKIKLNISFARFGDNDGLKARKIAQQCRKLLINKSIRLEISHDYLDKKELLSFLSSNSINIFLYDNQADRGISSATDWALAAGRPLAISKSRLFRHLFHCKPSICIENNSLKTILENGTGPIQHLWNEYSSGTILWEYETILKDILNKKNSTLKQRGNLLQFYLRKVLRKAGLMEANRIQHNIWTKTNDKFKYNEDRSTISYFKPVDLPLTTPLNRILDNNARLQYKPSIDFLSEHFPELIAKKIHEANVQQAFTFDTAVRLSQEFNQPKILAVGSFEDTAVQGLKLLNYHIDDIDPILNYDLGTFKTKPGIHAETYDIIVSTSVIEHIKDDEQFVKDIAYLLKKAGYAILTCDYNDQYKIGDDIPNVDFRFYTQKDIKERLMKAIPNCQLIDEPQWDCLNPDFYYSEKYNYTFASIVFQKII